MESRLLTIDSGYVRPGFASCFLRVQGEEAAFVETNTSHAVPKLLGALEEAGLRPEQVRWIIVTHVHLDHAGGAATLLRHCPNATLVAHPRAARHLIDPTRLVESSKAVYGEETFAKLYGEIPPAPAERVRSMEDEETLPLGDATLRFLHVRGHANHHFAVHDPARETVYTGDSFGLAYPYLQRAGRFVFASTSPTDFDGPAAKESVDRILGLKTKTACLTHFGELDELELMAEQLHEWLDFSQALFERLLEIEPEKREEIAYPALLERMEAAAEKRGLALTEEDWDLLSLDLRLNAQGLAFAAGRAQR